MTWAEREGRSGESTGGKNGGRGEDHERVSKYQRTLPGSREGEETVEDGQITRGEEGGMDEGHDRASGCG